MSITGIADTGILGDIGKGAVAVVAEEGICWAAIEIRRYRCASILPDSCVVAGERRAVDEI